MAHLDISDSSAAGLLTIVGVGRVGGYFVEIAVEFKQFAASVGILRRISKQVDNLVAFSVHFLR